MITPDLRSRQVDEGYNDFEAAVASRIGRYNGPLFRTDTVGLWSLFLNNLPTNRAHYNCRSCNHFIERFGGLVSMTVDGFTECVAWPPDVPAFFQQSVKLMREAVLAAKVVGVFLSSEEVFGVPQSPKGWTHLHATNANVFSNKLLTDSQREAELVEEYALVQRSLAEFKPEQVDAALQILQSEQFEGFEKGVQIAEWFHNLVKRVLHVRNSRLRENIVWCAVATAPPGFTHLKNGMVGTLFKDIAEGKTFEQCRKSWHDKMHPLKYQRPQAAPSVGQVENGEKVVERLGIQNSLRRRFANVSDLKHVFWKPKPNIQDSVAAGVFGHLLPEANPTVNVALPNQTMTWMKFQRDILPNIRTLEIDCPGVAQYMAMTTAEDPTAPPILQWDREEDRNPVSYYVYHGGSHCNRWGLRQGWNDVTAMAYAPFYGLHMHHHQLFVFFVIKGCVDANNRELGLFPAFMRSELRAISPTIEAFSKRGKVSGVGDANGLSLGRGDTVKLRVNGSSLYTLDRWE